MRGYLLNPLLVVGFSLITSYPSWFLLICLLAGAAFAGMLYFDKRKLDFGKGVLRRLAVLRGFSVSLIAFLLLLPLIKNTSRYTERPVVLLALDNSSSVIQGRDSAYYRNEFAPRFRKLADKLSEKYDVRTFTFGEKVSDGLNPTFTENKTNMEALFGEVRDRFSNRNLAALVMASDGIYNQGTDPLYASDNAPYSIYTVALGDTSQQKDILVSRVNYNRIAFLGNDFPVEITITAHKATGTAGKIHISSGNQQLYSENFTVNTSWYTHTYTTKLTASKAGIQRYRVTVPAVPGEISTANNYQDILVEVLDGRQKILLLSASPHPDVAAIKQSIENNRNYTVDQFLLADFNGSLAPYSLVILNQVPSLSDVGFKVINQLKNIPVPVLYVLGSQSNLAAYNNLSTGLKMPQGQKSFNDATCILNPDFSLFSLSPEMGQVLASFPPLCVPYGQYVTGTAAQVLIYQRIGNVNTRMPLVFFNQGVDRKSATFAGEGIWRWRLANFAKTGNQDAFNELFTKIIQYLAVKEDKSRFRVSVKNSYSAGDAVEIDAELYNESYQLVNAPEVNLVITGADQKKYPFTFTRTSNAYFLNAGIFQPGDYSYIATTSFGGKAFEKSGKFSVLTVNTEAMNTVANHGLLNMMASRHHGKMVYPAQLDQVEKLLAARDDLKTIVYSRKRYTDLVSFLPFLLLIIGLLSAEWFIRKRNGGY